MFEFFTKIFNKKKTGDNNNIGFVKFSITTDDDVVTELYWPDFTDKSYDSINNISKSFGALIYGINNGYLKNELINTLKQAKIQNPTDKDHYFLDCINDQIDYLLMNSRQNHNSYYHKSMVPPSSVFKK